MSAPTVAVQAEGVRVALARARVAAVVQGVLRAERARSALISVTFLTARRMAAMNRRHLGHAGPTDVISFGFRDAAGFVFVVFVGAAGFHGTERAGARGL